MALVVEENAGTVDLLEYLKSALLAVEVDDVAVVSRHHRYDPYHGLDELREELSLHAARPQAHQNEHETEEGAQEFLTREYVVCRGR